MITQIKKFSAEWCGPCKVLRKNLDEVLELHPEVQLLEYDADVDEATFEEFGIKNVPQLFFYDEDGTQVHHLTGAVSVSKLKDILAYHKGEIKEYDPYKDPVGNAN